MYFWVVRKMSRLSKFAGSVFLIGIVWTLLFFARSIFAEPLSENQKYIPADAKMVVIIDIHRLVERGFEDIVLREQDNDILQSIVRYITEKQESDIEVGIDYNSKLIHFMLEHKNKNIQGTLLNLYDPEAFSKNIHQLISPNDVFFVRSDVGLILSDPTFRSSPAELKAIGDTIMDGESAPIATMPWKGIDPMMSLYLSEPSPITKLGAGINVGIEVSDNMVMLEGQLTFPQDSTPPTNVFKGLQPDGFHLSSQFVPQLLHDSIASFLGTSLPEIKALSLNYRGTELVEDPGFAIVPDLDLILHFADSIIIDTLLQNLLKSGQIEKMTATTFIYGNRMFYHVQVSPNILYIGKTPFGETRTIDAKQLALMQGDLKAISSVEGKGMMRKLLELVSMYTSGRDFAETTEAINISLKLVDDKTARISGDITFKEGHHAINEIIKLLLNGKFL